MDEKPYSLEINPSSLNFKEFLEQIRDNSGLSTENFLKYKITLPINDLNTFKMIKNCPNLTLELEKRTEEELKDETYLKELNKIDPKLITIKTELNEFYAKTNIIQYYKNYSDKPIELILKFPYNPNIQFSKFTLEMNNKKVISKVLDKEKAEEKYNDAIAQGNTGVISNIKEKNIEVNIGNIGPGELIKLTTEFIQFLIIEDMSYCYTTVKNFPYFSNNMYTTKDMFKIEAKIKIKTHSRITRLITNGFRKKIEKIFNNEYTQCELNYSTLNFTNKERIENEFKILFRTQKINELNLIKQYDPEKDETSCIINMVYNYKGINIPLYNEPDLNEKNNYIQLYQKNIINSNPSLFIFLIDQSGSMSGERLDIAKESLTFFLKSLPKNSYYQLIGFCSNFNYIFSKDPSEYTIENVTKTIEELNNIDAYGGTNLLKPLEIIFKSKKYDNINLSRNLFILTDGEVQNSRLCLNLISKNTQYYRVHSFGIGSDYNKKFIEKAGKNGSYNFVDNIQNLKLKVIESLNQALRSYLYEPKIKVENINNLYEYFPKQKVYYQDEVFKYYFISKSILQDKIKINLEYYVKNELIKKDFIFDENNTIKEEDGNIISKIIIGNLLNNNSFEINKDIELAKKYQVLSKNTSLYAEVENDNANAFLSQLEVVEQSNLDYIEKNNNKESEEEKESSNDSDNNEDIKCGYKDRKIKKKEKKDSDDSSSSSSDFAPKKKYKIKDKEKKCKKSKKPRSEKKEKSTKKQKLMSYFSPEMEESSEEEGNEKKSKLKKIKIHQKEGSEEEKKNKKHLVAKLDEPNINFKDIILTQNMIEGNWTLNSQTENLIKENLIIYNKIKNYVENNYQKEDKEDIIITILVLYLLKNNKNIIQGEYILIINKGLQYLESKGIKEILYNNIETYLNKEN